MDEYHGQGGSYILDPETGRRTLLKRTLPSVRNDATPDAQTLILLESEGTYGTDPTPTGVDACSFAI